MVFVILGSVDRPAAGAPSGWAGEFVSVSLPVLASILIALSAVMSLITIVSIYREGGILKRLRATPLRPHTILTAHVLVKLLFTAITLALMFLAGKRYYPVSLDVPLAGFTVALLFATLCILSLGFLIASLSRRPGSRSRSPASFSIRCSRSPGCSCRSTSCRRRSGSWRSAPAHLRGVACSRGFWKGEAWSAHIGDVAAMTVIFLVCTALSAKVFRWE